MATSSDRPTQRVVRAVAELEDVDPIDLEPLYEAVDPSALDALFPRTDDGDPATAGSVQFGYAQHTVVVHSDGTVRIDDSIALGRPSPE